jgi:hypothetical protein
MSLPPGMVIVGIVVGALLVSGVVGLNLLKTPEPKPQQGGKKRTRRMKK